MGQRMRVAITGGDGMVGGVLQERLDPRRFELVPLGRDDADVTDLAALERAFASARADAVVHLAANAHVTAPWDELVGPNVVGAYHAFEAARRTGVRRVVFASSNHAVGMYLYDDERFADPGRQDEVAADAPVRPDSMYGATKAWGEALGRLYAERHGLEVVCVRIGWVTADDDLPEPIPDPVRQDPAISRRALGMWLSHRDCASLIEACLTAPVRWALVHGVSDNPGNWLSLDAARRLGWEPADGLG
jgi:nucleoside-diphosphate-sugar epimerase